MSDLAKPATAAALSSYTTARLSLASTGVSLSTRHALDFALAHAQARDAVHSTLDLPALALSLDARALAHITLQSAADDRTTYLCRPDLGRSLSVASVDLLEALSIASRPATDELQAATALTILLADGLSAAATNIHAIPLLDELLSLLTPTWTLTPIILAQQARVALADPIGRALRASATLILLGERPGLSSHDSLGAYITWSPRHGRTDAERNCVSNINAAGLPYLEAARKIAHYLTEGRRLSLSGVAIRESDPAPFRLKE